MNKKKIPLAVKKSIDAISIQKPELIKAVSENDSIVVLKEKGDIDSVFYFKLLKVNLDGDKTNYNIDYKPSSEEHLRSSGGLLCNITQFESHLNKWVSLLEQFNQESPIFDDTITNQYYEELEPKFQIIDDDAKTSPFNFEQQGLLLGLYEKTRELVKSHQNPENTDYANIILEEINKAEAYVNQETKQQGIDRLRKITAMCWKYSYQVVKAILAEVLVEVGKRLLTGGL